MIGLADKEGDGQVNWLNFYEFINGNGISEDIKKMKRIDDEEEIEYEDDDKFIWWILWNFVLSWSFNLV